MATFEQRDQSGALFKNSKKTESKHPDYQGDCMVNGVKMRMSAWLKESNGTKFMSLAFSEPYVPGESVNTQRQDKQPNKQDVGFDDIESDIPF
jgi:hypothetical protein